MALKACPECAHEVSPSAANCPKCGHPIRKRSSLVSKLVVVGLLVVAVVFVYERVLSQEAKEVVNIVAASQGVTITPWSDRAQAVLNQYSTRDRAAIAKQALAITHPSGVFGRSSRWQAVEREGAIALIFSIDWQGGLLGTDYSTTVEWRANENGHISATVGADTAPTNVASANREMLDDYFEAKVWPAVNIACGG